MTKDGEKTGRGPVSSSDAIGPTDVTQGPAESEKIK